MRRLPGSCASATLTATKLILCKAANIQANIPIIQINTRSTPAQIPKSSGTAQEPTKRLWRVLKSSQHSSLLPLGARRKLLGFPRCLQHLPRAPLPFWMSRQRCSGRLGAARALPSVCRKPLQKGLPVPVAATLSPATSFPHPCSPEGLSPTTAVSPGFSRDFSCPSSVGQPAALSPQLREDTTT